MYGGNAAAPAGPSRSFVDRVVGVARLDRSAYEEVERDQTATTQAAIVVVAVAIAGAIGGVGDGAEGAIVNGLLAILSWVIVAAFVYLIGTRVIPSKHVEADLGQVLRTTGFAQIPGILVIVGAIAVIGPILALVAFVWGIVTLVIAIQSALEASVGRAIAIGLIGVILAGIVTGIIQQIFGVGITG